jgi:hypothetical protein
MDKINEEVNLQNSVNSQEDKINYQNYDTYSMNPDLQADNQKDSSMTMDPYMAHMLIMRSEMYIVYNYPHLTNINQKIHERYSSKIPEDSAIFLIKGFTEEDIHKAIKYKVWSSTNYGNSKLNNEFKNGKQVYLLFSAYKTSQFTGLAQMKSEVNFKNVFPLWARDNWRGTFEIEWQMVKDVPFKEFRNIKCEPKEKKLNGDYNFINYSTKSLLNSPDCQRIETSEGNEIIDIMQDYQNRNSILEHFEHYDTRQANYEMTINMSMNNNMHKINMSSSNYSGILNNDLSDDVNPMSSELSMQEKQLVN